MSFNGKSLVYLKNELLVMLTNIYLSGNEFSLYLFNSDVSSIFVLPPLVLPRVYK